MSRLFLLCFSIETFRDRPIVSDPGGLPKRKAMPSAADVDRLACPLLLSGSFSKVDVSLLLLGRFREKSEKKAAVFFRPYSKPHVVESVPIRQKNGTQIAARVTPKAQ